MCIPRPVPDLVEQNFSDDEDSIDQFLMAWEDIAEDEIIFSDDDDDAELGLGDWRVNPDDEPYSCHPELSPLYWIDVFIDCILANLDVRETLDVVEELLLPYFDCYLYVYDFTRMICRSTDLLDCVLP